MSLALLTLSFLFSQTAAAKPVPGTIYSALTGSWTGELQLCDVESNRVSVLPTWLEVTVSPDKRSLIFHYLYDEGSTKLVQETSRVTINLEKDAFTVSSEDGKESDVYQISGADKLSREGLGTLTMTGSSTEDGKKIEVRITLRIGRNDYHFIRETRLPDEPFRTRDGYSFTRRNPPTP